MDRSMTMAGLLAGMLLIVAISPISQAATSDGPQVIPPLPQACGPATTVPQALIACQAFAAAYQAQLQQWAVTFQGNLAAYNAAAQAALFIYTTALDAYLEAQTDEAFAFLNDAALEDVLAAIEVLTTDLVAYLVDAEGDLTAALTAYRNALISYGGGRVALWSSEIVFTAGLAPQTVFGLLQFLVCTLLSTETCDPPNPTVVYVPSPGNPPVVGPGDVPVPTLPPPLPQLPDDPEDPDFSTDVPQNPNLPDPADLLPPPPPLLP